MSTHTITNWYAPQRRLTFGHVDQKRQLLAHFRRIFLRVATPPRRRNAPAVPFETIVLQETVKVRLERERAPPRSPRDVRCEPGRPLNVGTLLLRQNLCFGFINIESN